MNFSEALQALKEGKKVSRQGWNGKGMFLVLNGGYTVKKEETLRPPFDKDFLEKQGIEELVIQPHIDMWTAQKTLCVGWLASQMDMVADDWGIVE
jgi:hypothetical protein